jgi:PPOX class probable F420-dependent enzyme
MAIKLTDQQKKFFTGKNFAHIATTNKDGSPQVTPVWIDFDGTYIIVNSEQKRLKVRNLKRDPRVSLSVCDAENPYSYIGVKGRVVEITTTGGFEGIDKLAQQYIGQEKYPWNKPDDVRVVIKIEPEKASGQG